MGLLQVLIYWFILGLVAVAVRYFSLEFSYHRVIFCTSFIMICQLVWNFKKRSKNIVGFNWKYIWNFWLYFPERIVMKYMWMFKKQKLL